MTKTAKTGLEALLRPEDEVPRCRTIAENLSGTRQ
jgi:hypothetical protein